MFLHQHTLYLRWFQPLVLILLAFCIAIFGCHSTNHDSKKLLGIWNQSSLRFDRDLFEYCMVSSNPSTIWISAISMPERRPAANLPISVFFSHDAGNSWSYYNFPGTENYPSADLSSISADSAWIMIDELGLMRTINGGKTWENICYLFNGNFHNVGLHFFNRYEAVSRFKYTDDRTGKVTIRIFKTFDGGFTWSEIEYAIKANEMSYYTGKSFLVSSSNCIAFATNSSNIYFSRDRGNSWNEIFHHSYPDEALSSLAIFSSKKMVVSSKGRIIPGLKEPGINYYINSKVFYTYDGGISWKPTEKLQWPMFNIACIPGNDSVCIATSMNQIGNYGKSYISTNGGKSFIEIDSVETIITSATFFSISVGYGVKYGSWLTSESCNSVYHWNPQPLFKKGILKR